MAELLYEEETYRLRGAIFEVYKEKGCGFLEAVYQECLEIELGVQNVPFVAQPKVELDYRGHKLKIFNHGRNGMHGRDFLLGLLDGEVALRGGDLSASRGDF